MAKIPKEGLIKIVKPDPPKVSSSERASMIRKGNSLFNSGDIDQAKTIFISMNYSDGITRVGDHHYKNSEYMEALRMYKMAPAPEKAAIVIKQMAEVIQTWLD